MKVFSFSGETIYSYGVRLKFKGQFYKEEGDEIRGYIQEEREGKTTTSAIKGIYNELTNQMLFIKTSRPGGYSPEIYIFEKSFMDGWLSSYNIYSNAFFVYAGVRNGEVKLNSFQRIIESDKEIEEAYSQVIEKIYMQSYSDSSGLSKVLVKDIEKYRWLFSFITHLKGSAK